MNNKRAVAFVFLVSALTLAAPYLRAQRTETRVDSAAVVYVTGNALVLKSPAGEVKEFETVDSARFSVEGKTLTIRELVPGMTLMGTITTAAPPRWVDKVKLLDVGTVWKVIGSNLILTTPEGENKMYRVPAGGTVTVGGKERSLDQLRTGDMITATVVVTREAPQAGSATTQVLRPPPLPPRVGELLIDEGVPPADVPPAAQPTAWGTPVIVLLIVLLLFAITIVVLAAMRRRKKK